MPSKLEITEKIRGKHFLVVESGDADWKFTFGLYFEALGASFDYVDEEKFFGSGLDEVDNYPTMFHGVVIHLVSGGFFDSYKEKAVSAKSIGIPTVVTVSSQTIRATEIAVLRNSGLGVIMKDSSFDINAILGLLVSQMV